jgi:hypothetical protein
LWHPPWYPTQRRPYSLAPRGLMPNVPGTLSLCLLPTPPTHTFAHARPNTLGCTPSDPVTTSAFFPPSLLPLSGRVCACRGACCLPVFGKIGRVFAAPLFLEDAWVSAYHDGAMLVEPATHACWHPSVVMVRESTSWSVMCSACVYVCVPLHVLSPLLH